MCGICGIFNLGDGAPPDSALLRRMVAALRHRGPDGNGGYGDRHILLGHSRLAIIDLSGGAQPMSNEDDSLWVVFNGEIFNYLELGEELKQAGHRFRSRSDTEVLLHAYEQWGPTFVERCNGQFAFALWDRPQRRLMLCRDRVGILPLYYAQHGQRLFFASEIKALLQEPELPRRLDPRGLAEVFTFWTPVPPRTALTGIRQLRPGTLLLVEQGGRTEEKEYWQPVFPEQRPGFAHAGDERLAELAAGLRDRLEEATRLRMLRSDVPVGVYLSGGLDSSVIAALVRRFHQGPLRTFSLRFEHPDFDEGAFQQEMVQRLATEHSAVEVGYRAIARWFPEVIQATETPVLRTAPAPLFLLSGLVRQNGFKVVLTGEGSDEFLAGYDLFREDKVRRFWARCPGSQLRPLLLGRLYPWMVRAPAQAQALQRSFFGRGLAELEMPHFSHIPRWSSTAGLQRLFSRELLAALAGFSPVEELVSRLPPEANRWEPLCRAQYLEITTLLSGYLLSSQGDRMLMGHS
ncbi:MAG: asparagine synthase (glutamine-hydrolyzing), partial [Deltaproteobacteria bacterium]|nr:asparagine synthase (glutamine-hydrolyzing) [Deltaproteobacteria bacterium]